MVPYVQLSTNCGLNDFINVKNILSLHQKPILLLVDNIKYGTIAFQCVKSSLNKHFSPGHAQDYNSNYFLMHQMVPLGIKQIHWDHNTGPAGIQMV